MSLRLISGMLGAWICVFLLATTAHAQSAISGTVRDTTGLILPGATVEVSSPALIEKVRVVTTDSAGQYRIIDLRPGVYSVTFSLPGFTQVKREGVELPADFTATVNGDLRVGAVEETVTVTGESPIVDVQSTTTRQALSQEMLDTLPTGRNYATMAATMPAMSQGNRFDVGGSTTTWQGLVQAYGSQGSDMSLQVDGMSMNIAWGTGSNASNYYNEEAFQEMVFQTSGGNADTQTPGVTVNMIPKDGGNRYTAKSNFFFSNSDLESVNVDDDLRARGMTSPAKLQKSWDGSGSLGGPILQNRLWFFTSVRNWGRNQYVANVFWKDGRQASDDNLLEAYTARFTYQVTPKNKITASYDRTPRRRPFRGIEGGNTAPEATVVNRTQIAYGATAKFTSAVSNRVLYELGFSLPYHNYWLNYRPEVRIGTCHTAFVLCPAGTNYGDISHVELSTGYRSVAAGTDFNDYYPKYNITSALSFVTGSHALKFGIQHGWGSLTSWRAVNGDIVQRYQNGKANTVLASNSPTLAVSNLDMDMGLYIQDSWRKGRLTLNPGLRYDHFVGSVPEQNAPAGRFVPARHFDAIENLPNWSNVTTRFGASYDLFGDGRTAIKGSVGKYMQQDATSFPARYNPLVTDTDQRQWTDKNLDDIAQESELGPSSNLAFGVRRNRNPDPDIKRPFQRVYSLSLQREIGPGLSASFGYYRRSFQDDTWTDNLATTHADFTLFNVVDPRGNGQTIPVYAIKSTVFGKVNELDSTSSENTSVFNGFDFTLAGRVRNGTFTAGTSTGRTRSVNCQVEDPNSLRFCDRRETDIPLQTTAKLSGLYTLPYGIRVSGVFQSIPGSEVSISYPVTRTILPALLQNVTVRLNEPGSLYLNRVNQADISFSKRVQVGGARITPQLDLFNAFNTNTVVGQINTFGTSFERPQTVVGARTLRVGLTADF